MSFQISGSAHTSNAEAFEAVKAELQKAVDAIGPHVDGGAFTISITGSDHEHQAFSEYFTTQAGEAAPDAPEGEDPTAPEPPEDPSPTS